MTTLGIQMFSILAFIIGARLLFGKWVVNRKDPRQLHHTTKGYLLSTLGSILVLPVPFILRYTGFDLAYLPFVAVILILVFGGYQAFLEWWLIRESRRHLATLLTTLVTAPALALYIFFVPIGVI
ncbi:DUF4181 domain-containing protein [Saccharibacillus sp. JS10]|uniref:DUF4181 domain-containing protein n=1 Tax=Saccharibacillus sp. JS10 TaxID=2950552 RepID=UPI00210B27B6|nr:DUF4181 domain-containing protein [Saccharibacillus sp. JS10]MCQ4086563.1 DUF4181 domain-containing protein [Saccharibacillus sp. JS10]